MCTTTKPYLLLFHIITFRDNVNMLQNNIEFLHEFISFQRTAVRDRQTDRQIDRDRKNNKDIER